MKAALAAAKKLHNAKYRYTKTSTDDRGYGRFDRYQLAKASNGEAITDQPHLDNHEVKVYDNKTATVLTTEDELPVHLSSKAELTDRAGLRSPPSKDGPDIISVQVFRNEVKMYGHTEGDALNVFIHGTQVFDHQVMHVDSISVPP